LSSNVCDGKEEGWGATAVVWVGCTAGVNKCMGNREDTVCTFISPRTHKITWGPQLLRTVIEQLKFLLPLPSNFH
jgi:hypothetical protein